LESLESAFLNADSYSPFLYNSSDDLHENNSKDVKTRM
jgi:hypothetical protein